MCDSDRDYPAYRTLKDVIMRLKQLSRFSLCEYRKLGYYAISKLDHRLIIDPHGRPHFYTMGSVLFSIDPDELEKWGVTGMHRDSTTAAVEIYIKRIRIDSDIESIYSQRQYKNKADTDMRITRAIFLENSHIKLKKVIFNDPATIVFWEDGTKTVVKCDDEDEFDKEKGILYAALKKLSTREVYNDILRATDSIQDPFVEGVAFCTEAKDE